MSTKEFNQCVNEFSNALRSANPYFVRYQSVNDDLAGFPCYVTRMQAVPIPAFLCVIKESESTSVCGSINETKFNSGSEIPELRLTMQGFSDLRCRALIEINHKPISILGNTECDWSNGVSQLFFYAHSNSYTHVCIYDNTINQTPISIYTKDLDARYHLVMMYAKYIEPYKNLIDINAFVQEASLVCNQPKTC